MILGIILLELIGLATLYAYSIRNNGIVPVEETYHSLWKYGPTAGLFVSTLKHHDISDFVT